MIGCMRAAVRAGQTPKNTPTATLTPKARATDQPVMAAGIGENRPTSRAPPMPSRMPTIPPLTVRATASSRNWRSTSRVRAPTALRSPISRVRSDTLTSMMFITPTPPTTSEMPAIEARTRVRMPRMRPTTPRMSCWVRTWYSCSGWARVTTSRMIACSSSIWSVLGALTAIPSTRLTPNRRWAAVTGTNSSASRATPKAVPTRLITPTTRNRTPPTVTDLPTGSRPGNRLSAGSAPSTATRRRVSTSAAVKKAPRPTVRSNTSGTVSVVPWTLTVARRVPTRATSPEATVAATRRGSPMASPMRRTSSRPSRDTAGAEPKDRFPGATNRMLEPSDSTPEVTSSRAPLPIDTSRTTLATPITTPSMVSPERSLLARSASQATRMASKVFTGAPPWGGPDPSGSPRRFPVRGAGEAAVAEGDLAAEPGRDPGVVGDHHHRHPALAVEAGQQFQDLLARARVEVAGGLVGQQHGRVADQGPGDGHPLLLAPRELGGPVLEPVPEPDRGQGLGGQPPPLGPAKAPVDKGQADVGDRRGPGQQLEVLEHEPDDPVADRGQLVLGQPGDVAAVEAQGPRGRPVQPAEQPQQGRLARPARPHDGHRVAPLHPQVDPVQGPHPDPVQAVDLAHLNSLDHGLLASHPRGRLAFATRCRPGHCQPPGPGQSWPSRRRSAPRDTTRSPSRSPEATATRSSPSAATRTGRSRTLPFSTTN